MLSLRENLSWLFPGFFSFYMAFSESIMKGTVHVGVMKDTHGRLHF